MNGKLLNRQQNDLLSHLRRDIITQQSRNNSDQYVCVPIYIIQNLEPVKVVKLIDSIRKKVV